MRPSDLLELVTLGAIWGGSFLFLRVAAPEFGPAALIFVRVLIAAVFLTWILALRGGLGTLRGRAGPLLVLGTINSAIPFTLFAFAALSLPAGFSSVLNATAPLFGALVALLWLRERLGLARTLGLASGLAGVTALVWGKLSFTGARAESLAIGAGLLAALGYGIAAHYSKRRFTGVPPLAVAAGSQLASTLVLLPFGLATWPETLPSTRSLLCVLVLGVVCTGVAYLLYFRLIAHVGPTRAMTVTYLIPVFGLLWGRLFLGEELSPRTLLGGALILAGTMLLMRGPAPSSASLRPPPLPCPSSPPRSAP